ISNNGGGVLANNGSRFRAFPDEGWPTPGLSFHLQQTAPLGVYGLTEARITLHDAAGQQLVDETGRPLTATSGPDGRYTLSAVLPPGNLVARIPLWNGGILQALVTPAGRGQVTLDINTASTMSAAYVLTRFVGGQQAILDKLPASENERLTREFEAVRGYVKAAFQHDDGLLNEATDVLRARVAGVDRVLEDVKALLLGQAALGRGLKATEVPLAGPVHLYWLREGRLALGEELLGRIRTLEPDSTLAMLLDKTYGRIKNNAPTLSSMVEGPDGALYVAALKAHRVYRVPRAGEIQVWLGSGQPGRDAPGDPLAMACTPRCLAWDPDGTLWVGEDSRNKLTPARLLALRPDRRVEAYALPAGAAGDLLSLAVMPGPRVYVLVQAKSDPGQLWLFRDGQFEKVASDLATGPRSGLCVGPDQTLYLSEYHRRRLLRLNAGSLETAVEFKTGPQLPGPLVAGPDGTLYVSDLSDNVVWAGKPGAAWQPLAGSQAVFQQGETQAFAINNPSGVTADEQGRIYLSETGGNRIKRFDGRDLSVVVGGEPAQDSNLGDGGPAAAARLSKPAGITWHQGALYLMDQGHRRLRRIESDGTIQTVLSSPNLADAWSLTFDAAGKPCWPRPTRGVILRANDGGAVETLAGIEMEKWLGAKLAGVLAGNFSENPGQLTLGLPMAVARSPGGELYFSDGIGCRIYKLVGPPGGPHRVELFAGISLAKALARTREGKLGDLAAEEGGPAKAAILSVPMGLAFDRQGNLYVTEGGDRNLEAMAPLFGNELPIDPASLPGGPPRVRKITPAGLITTVAGPGGRFFPTQEGEEALYIPCGITVTPDGRLVFTDIGSNLVRILPAGSF
ncbi:MAG: hypothetical protein VKP62_14200, partial [Candidatus Sericytochromatia bacterium]|nr:hypothetical protein [Candidatus Sericytochromatia bacterium]